MRHFISGLAMLALVVAPASANFITDGDFEAPTGAAWTHAGAGWGSNYAPSTSATPAGAGAESARLAWTGGSGSGSQALLQTFTVPAGVNALDISWMWKTVKGGSNGWYEVLLLNGTGGSWDGPAAGELIAKEEYGFGPDTTNANWHAGSVLAKAVTPGGTYTIGIKTGGSPANGNQGWFDNVVVTPEPATAALLALAGLPLLRRRRHA